MSWVSKTGKLNERLLSLMSSMGVTKLKQFVMERTPSQALWVLVELMLCNDSRLKSLLAMPEINTHWRKFENFMETTETDHGWAAMLEQRILEITKEEQK